MPEGTVLALGGGGFSDAYGKPTALDRYTVSLTGKRAPRVAFLPTASGDSPLYAARFRSAYGELGCETTVISLFRDTGADLAHVVDRQDILYVGGGNTMNMLAIWHAWDLDTLLRRAWEQGKVMAGVSAGSICWFEWGLTDSVVGELRPIHGLGLLAGSNCPHYDAEIARRPRFRTCVASGELPGGTGLDNDVALHYEGERLVRIVSAREGAFAWRVREKEGVAVEERLEPEMLEPEVEARPA